jgi:rhodanese-related sulfurtransferase
MQKLLLIIIITTSSLTLFAQDNRDSYHEILKTYYKNTVKTIQPSELYKKILKGETIYLLDTREETEFLVSRIKGAIHVGYDKFNIKSTYSFAKNTTVIVYCTIGARSENIGEKLQKKGFKNVYNLYGGIIYWKNQGYPVIDKTGKATQNIHVYSKEWERWLKKGKAVH